MKVFRGPRSKLGWNVTLYIQIQRSSQKLVPPKLLGLEKLSSPKKLENINSSPLDAPQNSKTFNARQCCCCSSHARNQVELFFSFLPQWKLKAQKAQLQILTRAVPAKRDNLLQSRAGQSLPFWLLSLGNWIFPPHKEDSERERESESSENKSNDGAKLFFRRLIFLFFLFCILFPRHTWKMYQTKFIRHDQLSPPPA